jgi:hypothetical protein
VEARPSDADADVQRRQDATDVGGHVRRRRHPRSGINAVKPFTVVIYKCL